MTKPTIILTGFMSTGKSTVGRLLAEHLGRTFIDTDELIEERAGRSIFDIFQQDGEPTFRAHERSIAREFSGQPNLVIATGGGMMIDPLNGLLLGRENIVLCLEASSDEILSRLANDGNHRPLLEVGDPSDQLDQILTERAEAYSRFFQLQTTGKEPDQIIVEIIRLLEDGTVYPLLATGWFTVGYPGGRYPVSVGPGLLSNRDNFRGAGRNVVVTDSNVGPLHSHLLDHLDPLALITVPAGEAFKTLDTVRTLYSEMLACGADRQTMVITLGGGVVGDMAGFAAATFMRGLPLIQCPTTVLSMVDASVGAKTGVDLPQGKNLVGAFKQPQAVVADLNTLSTLEPADFNAGLAEIVKHGLIASPALFDRCQLGVNQPEKDATPVAAGFDLLCLIVEAILIKKEVVEADPFEAGRRKVLNLGHTFAHAIEQVSGYKVRHGEAVAIGLVAAANLSARLGLAQQGLQLQIESALTGLNLPVRVPAGLPSQDLVQAMSSDKKKDGERLQFVLIREIGEVMVSADVPVEAVLRTLDSLS